jgi:NAD(P)H-nitrite reductase large subunit
MIVCVCANISQEKLIKHIKSGVSIEQFLAETGASVACGNCYQTILENFKTHREFER